MLDWLTKQTNARGFYDGVNNTGSAIGGLPSNFMALLRDPSILAQIVNPETYALAFSETTPAQKKLAQPISQEELNAAGRVKQARASLGNLTAQQYIDPNGPVGKNWMESPTAATFDPALAASYGLPLAPVKLSNLTQPSETVVPNLPAPLATLPPEYAGTDMGDGGYSDMGGFDPGMYNNDPNALPDLQRTQLSPEKKRSIMQMVGDILLGAAAGGGNDNAVAMRSQILQQQEMDNVNRMREGSFNQRENQLQYEVGKDRAGVEYGNNNFLRDYMAKLGLMDQQFGQQKELTSMTNDARVAAAEAKGQGLFDIDRRIAYLRQYAQERGMSPQEFDKAYMSIILGKANDPYGGLFGGDMPRDTEAMKRAMIESFNSLPKGQ